MSKLQFWILIKVIQQGQYPLVQKLIELLWQPQYSHALRGGLKISALQKGNKNKKKNEKGNNN